MNSRNQDINVVEQAKLRRTLCRRQQRNSESALQFEQIMFERASRHLVLSLTFTYKDAWRPFITLDNMRRDRDAFLNNIPFNELLRDINGYIWKIEEGGRGGGIHMHVIIFYDGRRRGDIFISGQFKCYWEEVITGGRGHCDIGNIGKHKYDSAWGNFTGQIDAGDEFKREALREHLCGYMAKTTQNVTSRDNRYTQLFGVGYGRSCG